jgi:uncharacterized protein YfaS (alpha-2-macroglobulin family)
MGTLRNALSLFLFFTIFCGSLPHAAAQNALPRGVPRTLSPLEEAGDEQTKEPKGLRFRLSQGEDQPERPVREKAAPAALLPDAETENVLRRLPPVKKEDSDEQDFAFRERSLPRPRTGQTINVSFPSAGGEGPAKSGQPKGTLEVLRFAPEGPVDLAPRLSVTFSQPMVAVTSNEDLAASDVPVKLTPQPEGRWRWLGTKTLVFEPKVRFPAATKYNVIVPAEMRSQDGAALGTAKTWTFTTPAPKLIEEYPTGSSARRDPIIFLGFDQKVDSATLLPKIRISAVGGRQLSVRQATAGEIKSDKAVTELIKQSQDGRWVAIKLVEASGNGAVFPATQYVVVLVDAGTPSAEGPLTTAAAQSFSFTTYGPFKVGGIECGYNKICRPADRFQIWFTNPIDSSAFDQAQIKVEPEIPGLKTYASGNFLNLEGLKRGRTVYRVHLDASIKDQFGQTLEGDRDVTFNVGPAEPALFSGGEAMVVLDPALAKPTHSVYSINQPNLKVKLYKVRPEDWPAFTAYMRGAAGYDTEAARKQPQPPGSLVFDKSIPVSSNLDDITETRLDLSPALNNGLGQVVVIVDPAIANKETRRDQRIIRWVQSTGIGLTALVDNSSLVGWANSLRDGTPLSGVEMSLYASDSQSVSQADGLTRLSLRTTPDTRTGVLIARRGNDTAILPEYPGPWETGTNWRKSEAKDSLVWYVFDDRGIYKPGEEIHLKGWVRTLGAGPAGDVNLPGLGGRTVALTIKDSRDNTINSQKLALNALGGFDAVLKLPDNVNLGTATAHFEISGKDQPGHEFEHPFQVEEFRRPEFEVTAQSSQGPLFIGDHADATVTAQYYAGGGLSDAETRWTVTSTPTNYTPPNRSDFTFGKWTPWWIQTYEGDERQSQSFEGRTDASGKHRLRIDFDSVEPPRPSTVIAEASITDVNRQQWTARTTMLVHPADLYVGLKSDRTFVNQGEPLNVQAIVTDLDGKAISDREIKMRAVLMDWVLEKGEWKQKETNPQDCTIRSAGDAVKCTFTPKQGGTYRVTAEIRDDRERRNQSEITLWVAGGKQPPKRNLEQETVEIIPDRKEYRPGETAQLLVQSPFFPAEGVMTLARNGIAKTERFKLDGPTTTLKVPIEATYLPNINVKISVVGSASRSDDAGNVDNKLPRRPAFAHGSINLQVPPSERKLNVSANPRDKTLEPGKETTVAIDIKDANGRPARDTEAAVVVVDESILSLIDYKLANPLDQFYPMRDAGVSERGLREQIFLADTGELPVNGREILSRGVLNSMQVSDLVMITAGVAAERRSRASSKAKAVSADAPPPAPMESANNQSEIAVRENFNALAVFSPSVRTDADGRAEVKVKLPDSLTRYRVMAVAVSGGKLAGMGESTITARMPLMVRPSAPRFLNFGDKFELPVVVQNQTDAPMNVQVAVRVANASLTQGGGRSVTVPANDRVEVRFPVDARKAGTARFEIGAVSGNYSDAAQVELPVWTPATTEAFATYGEIDDGSVVQPFKAPSNTFPQFGGLEITTSSTQLQELTDAVLYLVSYPYECSEQLSSRILAVAALRDVLTAFKTKDLPSPDEMKSAVARDIKRLQGIQNDDGGFAFWRKGDEAWPYLSVHVAHALQRAKEKGFDVPDDMLNRSRSYLRDIEKHIPSYYSIESRRAITAYAIYVRNRMGDRDTARARQLIAEAGLENLPLEAIGWLMPVLSGDSGSAAQVAAIRRLLNNRATETAGAAHFVTSYTDGQEVMLHSARRADGIILEALIKDQPKSDLIPKIVRGLLANRSAGHWYNTQENAFILLALDRYFNTYEKTDPNFVARAWLGERYAGEQRFNGRRTDQYRLNVPMRFIVDSKGQQDLTLAKDGPGRLYYRIGMQYAPLNLKLSPADYGFALERVYEAVDDPSDVRRDADGTWHIKSGSRVRVRLTMTTTSRRYHVALVDPMPAGLEAMNPELAVTGSIPADKKEEDRTRGWWWYEHWFQHQNMRDERVEAFTSLLWEGVYNYSYVARATTPGAFVVPPPKAEEMYSPETYGRGATDRVVVEE